MASGFSSMTVNRTRTALSGALRPCSQPQSVRTSRSNRSAKFCLLGQNCLWRATIKLAAHHRRFNAATPSRRGRGREGRQAPFPCPVRPWCIPCSSSSCPLLQRLLDLDSPSARSTQGIPESESGGSSSSSGEWHVIPFRQQASMRAIMRSRPGIMVPDSPSGAGRAAAPKNVHMSAFIGH